MRHTESNSNKTTGKILYRKTEHVTSKTEHLKGIQVQLRRSYEPPALIPLVGPLDNKVKD